MRKRRSDRNDPSPHFKKQKLTERSTQHGVGEQAADEDTSQIRSSQDLQRLLAFSQDTDCQQARQSKLRLNTEYNSQLKNIQI